MDNSSQATNSSILLGAETPVFRPGRSAVLQSALDYSILDIVKLVANIQLQPNPEQARTLRATLERVNETANWLSQQAFKTGIFRQYDLHKLAYREIRERFGLTAQAAVRTIAKVADAYKPNRGTVRHYRWDAAQPYDDRIFRFVGEDRISLWTIAGRLKIPFVCGQRQRALLAHRKGEVDLIYIRRKWYVACVCDLPEPPLRDSTDVLGIDLGIINLAVDSDGKIYSGASVEENRRRYARRRRNLQKRSTRSARRKLRRISGREARFRADTNHVVSKSLVQTAERTSRTIALEELGGIRERVTARRRQRARFHGWAFAQLRTFVEYKAKREGVRVLLVDARNTSRECPECRTINKRNRPTQAQFRCVSCGYSAAADHVAARNIRARAVVNLPMVAKCA